MGLCFGVHAPIFLTRCAVYTSGIALLRGRVSSLLMQRTWRRSGGVTRLKRFGVLPTWPCERRRSRLQQPIAGSREQHACCAVLACVHVHARGIRHRDSFDKSLPPHTDSACGYAGHSRSNARSYSLAPGGACASAAAPPASRHLISCKQQQGCRR